MRISILAAPFIALSACSGSTVETFENDGIEADLSLTAYQGGATLSFGDTGYAYQVGRNAAGTALTAEADLTAKSSLSDPRTTGTATFFGPFELRAYLNPNTETGELLATGLARDGTLRVDVNFEDQTLDATDGTGAAAFVIDGSFSKSGTLSGTATFQGITGALGGDVSNSDAIGVFQGAGSNGAFAGGFIVSNDG